VTEPLPTFVYHPDPVATGSIVSSTKVCECCGRARGYTYEGAIYGADVEVLCAWCIADGSAHDKLGIELIDRDAIGCYGAWGTVSDEIVDVVANRTPGFSGWQQERWWVCCNDAAAFLGPAGRDELLAFGSHAIEAIRVESGFDGVEWSDYLEELDTDDGPTAYVFRCRHCGRPGGYSDCH
jgi:hypothetical protein